MMIVYEYINLVQVIKRMLMNEQVNYFEISPAALWAVRFFKKESLIKKLPWRLIEIFNEKGEMLMEFIDGDIIEICNRIEKERLINNSFLKAFFHGEQEKINIYILKCIHDRILNKANLINITAYYKRKDRIDHMVLYCVDNFLHDALRQYSVETGVDIRSPRWSIGFGLRKIVYILGYTIIFPAVELVKTLMNRKKIKIDHKKPLVAIWHNLNQFHLNKDRRSALFLFLETKVPFNQTLVYFENPGLPCDEEMAKAMDDIGVHYIAKEDRAAVSPCVPHWSVRGIFLKNLAKRNMKLIALLARTLLQGKVKEMICVTELFKFNAIFALHIDLFKSLNVKINVGTENFSAMDVPKYLAIKEAGGVRLCYQVSNIVTPQINVRGAVADVFFAFGPYYKDALEKSRSYIEQLVYSGYITDYSFAAVKNKAQQLKKQLQEKGATLVITFFDEGFGNEQYQMSVEEASVTHNFFARLVLENSDIAVIHKPKKKHLAPDTDIVRRAMKTGRFLIVSEGKYLIDSFPAESAQAADLTVGLLQSGTTNLESLLAGTPTFFLDHHKLYYYKEYSFGKDIIVFDNLESLENGIFNFKDQKKDIHSIPDELKIIVKQKDPFQDGKAINRIGDYMSWLMDQFEGGADRKRALAYAAEKFHEKWGNKFDLEIPQRISLSMKN